MKQIKMFCDVCKQEFPPDKAYAMLAGQHISVDTELNVHKVPFEGHYCGTCSEELLKKIHELRCAKEEKK